MRNHLVQLSHFKGNETQEENDCLGSYSAQWPGLTPSLVLFYQEVLVK